MNIREATPADMPAYFAHNQRHFRESGQDNDLLFHPILDFETWNQEEAVAKMVGEIEAPLDQPGWARLWITELGGEIVAAALLRSARLPASRHRCQFAIGIERLARGQGLGRRLSQQTIAWAKARPALAWMDLWVMAHNEPALALYRSLGFRELGCVPDQFRVNGQEVGDLHMALRLER